MWNVFAYLRLNQHKVNKQDDEIMLDVFVGEPMTMSALREADPFAERAVIGFAVGRIEILDGSRAGDAYWHACRKRQA